MAGYISIPLYEQYRRQSNATLLPGQTSPFPQAAWRDHMVDMVRSFMRGEPVYVRYTDEKKRIGSIGRVKSFRNFEQLVNGRPHWQYGRNGTRPLGAIDPGEATESDIKPENMNWIEVQLKWDKRANITNPDPYGVEWLRGYEGPTVWIFEEPEVPKVDALDRLGREVNVGDFICYILHHFDNYGASTQFGKVTKITRDGRVFAKNIKLGENETSAEKKINDNSTIVILTKDLMDQLMMARLSIL